jgi:hypothetical protein
MIRIFCDLCGNEMKARSSGLERLRRGLENVTVEVMAAVNGVYNAGQVCEACIIRVVNEGVDVPRNPPGIIMDRKEGDR